MFGAGAVVDAFLIAQGLRNLVLGLVTGALAKAAIPVMTRSAAAGRPDAGMASVRAALGFACLVLAVGATAVWVGAEPVVSLLAPGFDPATTALAVELTRIVLVATVLITASNLLAGAGYALGDARVPMISAVAAMVTNVAGTCCWRRSSGCPGSRRRRSPP